MNMDKAEESLNNYFDKVQSLVETNRQFEGNKDDMEQLAEILGEELKLERENEKQLRDEIKTLLDTCDSFSSLNFIDLKENVKKLQEENKKLKTEMKDLNELFNVEKTRLKQIHEENIETLKNKHNEETQRITEELRLVKEECEQQKNGLYTEIQLLQAQSAIQCDTVETKYFSQITDLNNKLRQVNSLNTNLRTEIQNTKAQYSIVLYNKEQIISELENKLKDLEKTLLESRIKLRSCQQSEQKKTDGNMPESLANEDLNNLRNFCNIESEFEITNTAAPMTTFSKVKAQHTADGRTAKSVHNKTKAKAKANTKYRPLEVAMQVPKPSNDDSHADGFEEFEMNQFTLPTRKHIPTIYIGGSRSASRATGQNAGPSLPPLKQCSNAKECTTIKSSVPKKRKLYNPDDLDYLDTLDGPD